MNDDDINEFRSFFAEGNDPDEDHEPVRLGVEPETYMELIETLFHQTEGSLETFGLSAAVTLCWAAAQPEAFEKCIDITEEAKFALGDWSDDDKAKLTAIEIRQVFYGCGKRAVGIEGHEDHYIPLAQVLRIGTQRDTDWHWTQVKSDYDFEQVLTNICEAYHQEHCTHSDHSHGSTVMIGSKVRRSRVREDFANKFQEAIVRRSVESFREELDCLFPSTPEEGGSHAEPGTG